MAKPRCVFWLLLFISAGVVEPQGTTPSLREIFIGRCEDFKQAGYDSENLQNIDCKEAWNAFFKAFAYKDDCGVLTEDYQPYFDIVDQVLPKGKSMFWSGTQPLAEVYSSNGANAYIDGQTMTSYLVQGLNWCGSLTDPSGMNYSFCRWYDSETCPDQATGSFWSGASERFAKQATGPVGLLLNGTRDRPAYDDSSFFALYEMPNLDPTKAGPVRIMVAQDLGKTPTETCNSGSLLDLKEDLKERGLSYTCKDNPSSVKHFLCGFSTRPRRECLFGLDNLLKKRLQDLANRLSSLKG
eukprot:m.308348 g.308348  ORF g.308348 m.308348 type:complete len:297 (+) comp43815_c0_seq1:109-999(+)